MNKYYGNDNFNLQNAYDDCKQVFEGITDEESYQEADCGVVMYYANEIMCALEKALEEKPQGEWARHDEWVCGKYVGGFYHVNCLCEDGYYSKWETNFCPNCGAKMKRSYEE